MSRKARIPNTPILRAPREKVFIMRSEKGGEISLNPKTDLDSPNQEARMKAQHGNPHDAKEPESRTPIIGAPPGERFS
jgi:hypothetical protein